MLHVFQIIFLTCIQFLVVKCLIPDLSVQMLDQRVIQRKRQDTLEMCRLFNAETEKLRATTETVTYQIKGRRRPKRETGVKLSNKEVENARRVESIVDKLYEDLEENGEKVTYQKKKIDTLTTAPSNDLKNKTMRRFNFAPAELLGPLPKKGENKTWDDSQPKGIDWPKKWKHGIVPYFIDPKTYDSQLADTIIKAFDYFEKATCIRLQKLKDKPTDDDSIQNVEWLYITNPSGIRQCVHSNERKENKGVQMVVFGYDCMSPGEIAHEVMHQLGFSHEHTRPDRDQYVTILWNNIKSGYKKYFELRPSDPLTNVPYDFASVLHYPPRAFSKNGQVTVMAKPGTKIGQREGLSDGDVEKVGIIFGTDCVERNRQYLLKTCPSVVKADTTKKNVSQDEITEYFKDRLWPYGIVTYKLRDHMEFTAEERQNIQAVMRHIQKETCIQFRVVGDDVVDVDTNPTDKPKPDQVPSDNQPNTDIEVPSNNNKEKNNPDLISTTQTNIESTLSTVKGVDADKDASGDGVVSLETHSPSLKLTQVTEVTTKPKQNDAENEISPQENDDLAAKKKLVDHTQLRKVKTQDVPLRNIVPTKPKKTTKKFPRSQRRHAANILVLARSSEPGCTCPPPGKPDGNKVLHINADCFNSVNDLLHLFVHLLGLDHQHNMYDRDSYLHILWDNLTPDIKEEMKVTLPPPASVGFDYDYQSVMHYPWLQIKNGVTNIMYPIWNDGWAMGHWQGLSSTDVFKLNLIYYNQCLQRRKDTE